MNATARGPGESYSDVIMRIAESERVTAETV